MIPRTRKEAFKVLELPESADEQKIRDAYKKLISIWHPNKWVNGTEEEKRIADEKSKEITVAYGILTGKIKEDYIKQQPNNDGVDDFCKDLLGSHLGKEEINLFSALICEDLTKTKTLLKKVQNINAKTKLPGTEKTCSSILHMIVKNSCNDPGTGWIELLKEVLSKYSANNSTSAINLNIKDVCGRTPLYLACNLDNLDVINLLLEHGADPNVYDTLNRPLRHALEEDKIDIAKVLLKHGAKIKCFKGQEIIHLSKNAVEVLLPHLSYATKYMMLDELISNGIHTDNIEGNDHNIEIAKLLLDVGVDLNPIIRSLDPKKKKSKFVKLCNEYKESIINNSQKQSSGRRWVIVAPALLFSAIGVVLVVTGIIPEISAIGVIATAVLSGIAGAMIGGISEHLVDIAINQCCSNQQCAVQ